MSQWHNTLGVHRAPQGSALPPSSHSPRPGTAVYTAAGTSQARKTHPTSRQVGRGPPMVRSASLYPGLAGPPLGCRCLQPPDEQGQVAEEVHLIPSSVWNWTPTTISLSRPGWTARRHWLAEHILPVRPPGRDAGPFKDTVTSGLDVMILICPLQSCQDLLERVEVCVASFVDFFLSFGCML